jgi:hypothetical protein
VAGKQPLLSVHTAIDLGGAFTSDLTVPSLRYAEHDVGSISITSIHVRVQGDAAAGQGAARKYSTTSPGFELSTRSADGSAMTVSLGAVRSESALEPPVDRSLWMRSARSTSQMSSLSLVGSPPGGTSLKPVRATFDGLRMQVTSTLQKGMFSSTSSLDGRGRINDVAIDKVELRTSLRSIHAASYQKLVRTLLDGLLRCDAAARQDALTTMLPEAERAVASLLVHNPEYALDSLAVELGGKRAELSYSVGTRGVTSSDVALPLPAVLFSKGVLRGSFKVDRGLISQALRAAGLSGVAAASVGAPPSAGGSAVDPSSAMIDTMIEAFVERGYLQRQGEHLTASASFEAGQVLLNGKAMVLPDLASLSAP